ncbi:MAG: DUF6443 domain-containing protein [Bacteroidales bacterium]|nr:DUF6443 domain-containing protein [Bacteroidales bacterium]
MNWQYEVSFSEKAKKNAGVTYYDGLNYSRQKVHQMQSENNVMVGETKYDYHGREALKILSTPIASQKTNRALKYYDAFNKDQQGNPYSKDDFDKVANCKPSATPMSKTSGAAKYYSSNNALQSIFKDYLPKANGYPFSQKNSCPINLIVNERSVK